MITEDYVSFEIAKLLKEKGFNEWCFHCYGVAVLHNGADISFDEECELKDEGRENEIEYVEGGRLYNYASNNRENVRAVWAAPTLWAAMKWLRELKRCIIVIIPKWFTPYGCAKYAYSIWADDNLEIDGETNKDIEYDTYEETCEKAIKYCLENLI